MPMYQRVILMFCFYLPFIAFCSSVSTTTTSTTTIKNGCNVGDLPSPFTSPLSKSSGSSSSEISILQHFLQRFDSNNCGNLPDGVFNEKTEECVIRFQSTMAGSTSPGVVGINTANALLDKYSDDNYSDDGQPAAATGHLYKILIPVHRNRSIQTNATFLDSNNNVMFHFPVRAKGHVADACGHSIEEPWPNFNNTGNGLNMYSR
jgi:peptidoglycan hydrolase-like protein with peptidoglycan-binding domain